MPGPIGRPPHGRLSSLKQHGGPRRPRAPAAKKAPTEKKCTRKDCGSTNVVEEDGYLVCKDCFTQIAEINIVAEVQFNDEGNGAATVQGASVHENSRHAKTLGAETFKRLGGGGRNSLAETERAGKRALAAMAPKLGIAEDISLQAESLWNMAAQLNFSAGRKTDEVVAACLYAACRRRKDNAVLLMDIAELIKVNVFRLGEVYKDLCKELYLAEEGVGAGFQYLVELEPLIFKYCQKLQFADKTNIVAEDALKIIRRMNRDWIVSGRHPAGLCGACIILAARMNNFQRSVREVVYVSKVADVTIAKRVEEFRRTKSAGLTIEEFREKANRWSFQHDPPSRYLDQDRERIMANKKRKREEHRQSMARESQARESVLEIPDDATDASSRLSSLAPGTPAPDADDELNTQKRRRVDESGTQPSIPATAQDTQFATSTSNAQPQFVSVNTPPQTQEPAKRQRDDDSTPGADGELDAAKRVRTAEPETRLTQGEAPPQAIVTPLGLMPPPSPVRPPVRYDNDGFAIPALPQPQSQPPIDPAITGRADAQAEKPAKRGRKRKEDRPPEVVISPEELLEEDYLEKQIEAHLTKGEAEEAKDEVQKAKEEERLARELELARALSEHNQKIDADNNKLRRAATAAGDWFGPAPASEVEVTAEELEKEFENDPEVERCVLQPAEVEVKERIWVAHNEDWLRKQAEKELMAKNAPAQSKRKSKKGDKDKGKKKRSRNGDGSVLTNSSTPIDSPAEAARAMLEKRAKKTSAHVDFSALQKIYGRETPSRASSSTPDGSASASVSGPQSREQTPASARQPSATPAPSEAEPQAVEGAAASPEADAEGYEQGDAGQEQVDEEQADDGEENDGGEQGPIDNPAKHVQPATWDDVNDEPDEAADYYEDEEDDYRAAIGEGEEMDEFGVVGAGYESEGDEYE